MMATFVLRGVALFGAIWTSVMLIAALPIVLGGATPGKPTTHDSPVRSALAGERADH